MENAADRGRAQEPWIRTRHRIISILLYPVIWLIVFLRYGVRPERFRGPEKGPYLILYNHQTPLDQFFVGLSFPGAVYYLATEDIFSNGWTSVLLRWLTAPIPIRKEVLDIAAMRIMMQVAGEGGTIAIAPEGNRTYSGKTEHMLPTIASLAKRLGLPVVLYRIEGGYGVEPRWSSTVRRGPMRAYPSRVILPEEFSSMTNEELFEEIQQGLYVNDSFSGGIYKSRKKAEYLERAAYVCPTCGFSVFHSEGNEIECLSCHRKIRYREDKVLEGVDFDFPFAFFNDWYEFQQDFVNRQDLAEMTGVPIFRDQARVSEVIVYHKKILRYSSAEICLYGDRIEILNEARDPWVIPFSQLPSATVLGRNKLNLHTEDKVFQIRGDRRFNALKYVNILYRYKNMIQGDQNGEFLGL